MYFLQYIVFDKTGDHIVDANAVVCNSSEELDEIHNNFVEYYKTSGEMNDNQLTLIAFKNGEKTVWSSR